MGYSNSANMSWLQDPYLQGLASLGTSKKGRKSGEQYSNTDLYNSQFQIYRQEAEWQHNEDMYNKYQSTSALMEQYKDAGLNAALMYSGGSAVGAPVATSGDTPTLGHSQNEADITTLLPGFITNILSMLQGGVSASNATRDSLSQTALRDSEIAKNNQETLNLAIEADLKSIERDYAKAKNELALEESKARISKLVSDIAVNGTQVKVGQSTIELNDARVAESFAKTVGQNLTNEKAAALLPYVREVQEAYLRYQNAGTTALSAQAQKSLADTQVTLLEVSKQQGLLDAGIVDQEIKNMKAQRTQGYISSVGAGIGELVGAASGIKGLFTAAPKVIKKFTK